MKAAWALDSDGPYARSIPGSLPLRRPASVRAKTMLQSGYASWSEQALNIGAPHTRASVTIAVGLFVALWASVFAAPATAAQGSDWEHALRVAEDLRTHPPTSPVVLLLGGSCAREATVSDASWSAALTRAATSRVLAYNLGSRNQTFEQDAALVKALPTGPLTILIGVNRGRFTSASTTSVSTTPHATTSAYSQHHYGGDKSKTEEAKQALVRRWMRVRYPVFTERCAANLARLGRLVGLCVRRGYGVAIVDLPQDTAVIGHAFDAPITRYRGGCREIARKHGVAFLAFADEVGLTTGDFYDLDHLLESGRPKYQSRLTAGTVKLLPEGSRRTSGASDLTSSSEHILFAILAALALLVAAAAVQRRRAVVRRRRRARERRRVARALQHAGFDAQVSTPAGRRSRADRRADQDETTPVGR
jgi:hypothetical protein